MCNKAWVLLAVLSCASLPGLGAERVATVLGGDLSRSELETAGDEPAQVARFRDWVWERVFKHYVEEQGLAATASDIEALLAYDREFDRRDRAQRTRKLEELHQRLADGGLGDAERAHLEEFRRVLTRMAERDAENEREPPPEYARQAAQYAPWIEFWKANRALYEQYGGTVAATTNGPAPHGARVAVIADYERRGIVRFYDSGLRTRLFELMSRPPAIVVPPEQADFTPYWQLPIPPSYFPD
jgi:hypothetical protein